MKRSVNKVILIGNLGKDAETKFTPSGVSKSTFSIATERRWKDRESGEWKAETDWHNVVLWRSENVSAYLLKGKPVYIEGRLSTRSYESNGQKKYITEVIAEELILLGGRDAGESDQAVSRPRSQPTRAEVQDSPGIDDEDLPF